MNILLFANGYPDAREPQFGCFEKDQAIALQRSGHHVVIIYIDKRFRTYWRPIGITRKSQDGIPIYGIYVVPGKMVATCSEHLFYWVFSRILDKLYKTLQKETGFHADIIYAHFLRNIALASFLRKKYQIPVVGIEHWSGLNQKKLSSRIQYLGRLAYENADQLIAVSASLQKLIQGHFNKKAAVVHNMIGEEFLALQPHKYMAGKTIRMISTGSLIHRKGFDILIQALGRLSEASPHWQLTVIGEGPERKHLQHLIIEHRLADKIQLVGRKNKHEIAALLQESDLFVFPSRAENFSVAVLEALAAGLPVVATLCGGIQECIHSSNGLLVHVEDIQGMAQTLQHMLTHLSSYDRLQIAADCRNRFAPQVIAQRLTAIFEQTRNNK